MSDEGKSKGRKMNQNRLSDQQQIAYYLQVLGIVRIKRRIGQLEPHIQMWQRVKRIDDEIIHGLRVVRYVFLYLSLLIGHLFGHRPVKISPIHGHFRLLSHCASSFLFCFAIFINIINRLYASLSFFVFAFRIIFYNSLN